MAQNSKDKPYHDLQRVYARHPLGAPESETFIEILKCYFDPDEARLAAARAWSTPCISISHSTDQLRIQNYTPAMPSWLRCPVREDQRRIP